MERDQLEDAVDGWVDRGIISRSQAEEILDHAERTGTLEEGHSGWIDTSSGRLITVVSVMGAVLVGVGVLLYLTANWEEIPRSIRGLLLVSFPVATYVAGGWFRRGRHPRVGHSLFAIGAGFVGVSLFALEELYALGLDPEVLLLAWTTVALLTGHALVSRLIVGLGLAVGAATLVTTTSHEPMLVVGLYGVILFALGRRIDQPIYQSLGVVAALGAAVVLAGTEGGLERSPTLGPTVVATGLGAAALSLRTILAWRGRSDGWPTALWTTAGTLTLVTLFGLSTLEWSALTGSVVGHLFALALVVATVGVGYRIDSVTMINVAVVGFLFTVVSILLSTVVDALTGALALIVSGSLLLLIGLGLERGRRTLLERMGARSRE